MKQLKTDYMQSEKARSFASRFPVFNLLSPDKEYTVLPGFCDVHVHFREPGFSYKERISTGYQSAARGGYTAVCTMPNLKPVPDSVENILKQTEIIENQAENPETADEVTPEEGDKENDEKTE